MSAPLVVSDLHKAYGDNAVLKGVGFSVEAGQVVGLLGANGAGKSTTGRLIAGLLRPDQGQVLIGGVDVAAQPERALAQLGYMPEAPFFYPELTVAETLRLVGDLRGLATADRDAWIDRSLQVLDLEPARDRRVSALSMGMRRKLSLAAALAGEPSLMLLDEPTNGLDPPAVALFKDVIIELRRRGRGVLVSSHLLALLEPLCDRLAILESGEVRAAGTLAELRQQAGLGDDADLEAIYLKVTGRERSEVAELFA